MEAQATHRRAGVQGKSSNPVAAHVANQNQVLKWLQDFSDKVEGRAKGAAAEVNALLEEAGALELDMKTALVSFDNLKHRMFIEHKISDHNSMDSKMRDGTQGSLQSQVPAQDYERDILPRYKEALHIGLASCKEHFRNKGRSTTSVFRAMSTYGLLPHIIGSEEYNHDNSCGLADDVLPLTDDFSWLREFQGESSDSGAAELFESQPFGVQQGSEKGETGSLVSAAREFKAMLEAALVNPYKFYDNASVTDQDVSVENPSTTEVPHNTGSGILTGSDEVAHERSTEADNSEETGFLASLQSPNTNVHDFYSALIKEGLFDPGDEIMSVESADTSTNVPLSGLANLALADSAERTFSLNENVLSEENLAESSSNYEEHAASPPEQKDGVSGQC